MESDLNSGNMKQQLMLSKVLVELYAMQDSRPKTIEKLRKRLDGRVMVVEYCDPLEILDMLVKHHDFDAKVIVKHVHEHIVPKQYMSVLGKELCKAATNQLKLGNVPVIAPPTSDMLRDAKSLLTAVEFKDGFEHENLTKQLVEICTRQPTDADDRVTKVFKNLVSTGYVVFDEATSRLDAGTEALVKAEMDRARKGRSALIIAHRLRSVSAADQIHVLHHGCIRESGGHDELLAENGLYARLWRLQDLANGNEEI